MSDYCRECGYPAPVHSRTCAKRSFERLVPRYEDQPGSVTRCTPATDTSAARKATPMWSGVLRYFPDAIAAVARLSKKGNDKHNPGEPLHWSRGKSNDHGDCIVRHQMNPEELDPDTGEIHAVAVAWRALAQLQLLEEKRLGNKDLNAAFEAFKEAHRK